MLRENLALNGGILAGFLIGQALGMNVPLAFAVAFFGVMNAYFLVMTLMNRRMNEDE